MKTKKNFSQDSQTDLAEIQMKHQLNRGLKCYLHTNLFGVWL
jgi:hypothetical protein